MSSTIIGSLTIPSGCHHDKGCKLEGMGHVKRQNENGKLTLRAARCRAGSRWRAAQGPQAPRSCRAAAPPAARTPAAGRAPGHERNVLNRTNGPHKQNARLPTKPTHHCCTATLATLTRLAAFRVAYAGCRGKQLEVPHTQGGSCSATDGKGTRQVLKPCQH